MLESTYPNYDKSLTTIALFEVRDVQVGTQVKAFVLFMTSFSLTGRSGKLSTLVEKKFLP